MGGETKEMMVEERSWEEFRASGLAWWINRLLHTFGWTLVFDVVDHTLPDAQQKVTRCYPARCRFRGFDNKSETEGFRKVTAHTEESLPRLKEDLTA